jgi:excisionase family DNA binding protein
MHIKKQNMKKLVIERISVEDLTLLIRQVIETTLNQWQSHDEFFTVSQASEYLKMPITTLYDYTSNKKIPFHKKGKTLHFSKQELTTWMKQKKGKEVSHEPLTKI